MIKSFLFCSSTICFLNAATLSEKNPEDSFVMSIVESALNDTPQLPTYLQATGNTQPPTYSQTFYKEYDSAEPYDLSMPPPPYEFQNFYCNEKSYELLPTYEDTLLYCQEIWMADQYVLYPIDIKTLKL